MSSESQVITAGADAFQLTGPAKKALLARPWVDWVERPWGQRLDEVEALLNDRDLSDRTLGMLSDVKKVLVRLIDRNCFAAPEEAEAGLPIQQEPKYTITPTHIVNRATGRVIPRSEPVFILRAQDKLSLAAFDGYIEKLQQTYSGESELSAHFTAVCQRRNDFVQFQKSHPDKVKDPDTSPLPLTEPTDNS